MDAGSLMVTHPSERDVAIQWLGGHFSACVTPHPDMVRRRHDIAARSRLRYLPTRSGRSRSRCEIEFGTS
jgi:hypothetical protein